MSAREPGRDVAGDGSDRPTLTYAELADRIEQALGERPAVSTLRAAPQAGRYAALSRITHGIPAPLPGSAGGRVLFDAAEVDQWLADHPRRELRRQQQLLIDAPLEQRPAAVAAARTAGLSWQRIADALTEADGAPHSKQAVQQRHKRASN